MRISVKVSVACFVCGPSDELPEMPLKVKKSELRLYCDLLMQQVHSVKCAVQDKDQPDIEVFTLYLLTYVR